MFRLGLIEYMQPPSLNILDMNLLCKIAMMQWRRYITQGGNGSRLLICDALLVHLVQDERVGQSLGSSCRDIVVNLKFLCQSMVVVNIQP